MGKPLKKVNPQITSYVNRNWDELLVKEVVRGVYHLDAPWESKKRGRKPHDPRVVVICCVLMVALNRTYEGIEAYLKQSKIVKDLLGDNLPTHSVIHRGMQKLTQKYIKKLNKRLIIRFRRKGMTVILDSTGFSLKTSSKWFDIRIGRKNSRRDNDKLHISVCSLSGIIQNFSVTNWKKHDNTQVKTLLKDLKEIEVAIGDTAYLARNTCNEVGKHKGLPFFLPKKGVTAKAKSSPLWKWMINLFKKSEDLFRTIYHIRSFVEAVFSSIKKRWNNFVRSIKKRMQKKELALKVISYNIKQKLCNLRAQELGISLWVECQ